MSKPDLTAIPYELDEEAIAWVRTTIDSLSLDDVPMVKTASMPTRPRGKRCERSRRSSSDVASSGYVHNVWCDSWDIRRYTQGHHR